MGLDPGVVGDRPMPHLLAALLTPKRAPHARLPKHWVGRIVSLTLVRHPHVNHTLACPSTGKDKLFHRCWSDTRFLLASLTVCFFSSRFSLHTFLFSNFSPHAFFFRTLFSPPFSPHLSLLTFSLLTFSLLTFSLQNVPLARFYISGPSPRGAVRPTGARIP